MPSLSRSLALSLIPATLFAGMWAIAASFGDFPFFHFWLGGTLVEATSTSWRALEVAVVSNATYVRGVEYCVLPKPHAPFLGMYLGPVAGAPGNAVLLLVPFYVLFLASLAFPIRVMWRASRKQSQPRGFEVA